MVTGAHRSAEAALWWRAYSKSIQDRRGSHPTTEAEARTAKEAADKAVAELRRTRPPEWEHGRMTEPKRLPPHITEDDIRLISQIIIPEIAANAWDEGYAKAMDTAMTTEAFQDDVNPYRKHTDRSTT